ncbi:hypothetical protein OHQ89_12155 [Streptomyces canus]|uniref:hypothetical protein n=1 Tax=Streptomyces canus TaxID=58343 RepID=UPI0030DF4DFD
MSLDPKSPSMKLWHRLLAAGASEDEATELMHGYAHELADQIREDVDLGAHPGEALYECEECATVRAANLIDPLVQQPPVDEYLLSTRHRIVGGGS